MIGGIFLSIFASMVLSIYQRSDNLTFISTAVFAIILIAAISLFIISSKRRIARRYVFLKLKYGGVTFFNEDQKTIAERIEWQEWNSIRIYMKQNIPREFKQEIISSLQTQLKDCQYTIAYITATKLPNIRGTIALLRDKSEMDKLNEAANKEGMTFKISFVPWRFCFYSELVVME